MNKESLYITNRYESRPLRGGRAERAFLPSSFVAPKDEIAARAVTPSEARVETAHTVFAAEPLRTLTPAERAKYFVSGALWTFASGVLIAVDQVFHFLDVFMFWDILWITSGLTAIRQLKAAVTGTTKTCVEFKCTKDLVQKNVQKFLKSAKDAIGNFVLGKRPCLDCAA